MSDITVADVTTTLAKHDVGFAAGKFHTFPSVGFGNATLTYPANGVPLPAMGILGPFKKAIQFVGVQPATIDGLVYKYDSTNHSLRIFQAGATAAPLAELVAGTAAPAATVIKLHVIGS